jgi:ATP-dependent Lon protease
MTERTRYPVLPIRNAVLFPNTALPLAVVRPGGRAAADRASLGAGILVVAQRTPTTDDPAPDDLFDVGTLATVTRDEPGPERNGTRERQLVVHGIARFRVTQWHRSGALLEAEGVRLATTDGDVVRVEVMAAEARRLAESLVEATRPAEAEAVARLFTTASTPEVTADLACTLLPAPVTEKQRLLEERSLETRLDRLLTALARERERVAIAAEIQGRVVGRLSKEQREHVLREQLRALQEELGDNKPVEQRYRQLFQDCGLEGEALRVAEEELRRLEHIPRASPEYHVIRSYLDTLTALPWNRTTRPPDEDVSLDAVEERLNRSHSGLKEAKDRFIEHLAMAKLSAGKGRRDGKVLCLLGPPGVGKTSFAKAAAEALGRTFTRVSLGGLRDESEIRGHRRTYVGAMPGRILQALRRAKTRDPLCLLDEIDKVASDWRGDPASALLEVLDPEQNATFVDHYVDVPFDLSEVFFVATANSLDPIPPALRDRMEVLTLPSYSREEKIAIARHHFLPRFAAETPALRLPELDEETLGAIVDGWAREAGVRELGRALEKIVRHAARRQAQYGRAVERIGASDLVPILGPRRSHCPGTEPAAVGRALALGWSPSGGQVLPIEVERTAGRGQWTITGRLGDVMRESAQVAMTLARTHVDSRPFHRWDWHVHVPEGAVPKDGPSAGAALLVAVVSRVTGKAPTDGVAYTGEITLGGQVLAIGGVREKVLAADRAGLRRVVLPRENAEELDELPASTRNRVELLPVATVVDVLRIAGLAGVAPEPHLGSLLLGEATGGPREALRPGTA